MLGLDQHQLSIHPTPIPLWIEVRQVRLRISPATQLQARGPNHKICVTSR